MMVLLNYKSEPKCIGCKKTPDQILEYVLMAQVHEITPVEFVIRYEGTLNAFEPNQFYCTPCYIEAGMPLSRRTFLQSRSY